MKTAIWVVRNAEREAEIRKTKEYASLSKTHDIKFHRVDETPMKPGPSVNQIIIIDEVS